MDELAYTGERLVAGEKTLQPMRVENFARYRFFMERFQGQKILDMGCGDGEGSGYLRNSGDWKVYSIDIAEDATRFARQAYGEAGEGLFARMDVLKLAFADGVFDGVVSVEVIEHIPDPEAYLSEARRVLKPGGVLVLTTPNRLRTTPPGVEGSLWPAHIREYTPQELREMAQHHFSQVELWGEQIPVYEGNIFRKVMRQVSPFFKRVLPHALRIRALPALQFMIKSQLAIEDVEFSTDKIDQKPTLVLVCQ